MKFRWLMLHFEEALCALLFGVMGIIMFVNVISRYLLKYSLAFTEELVVSFFVWLTLLGTAIAFREGSHLGFTFIADRLPLQWRRLLLWFNGGLAVILFLFLIYFSYFQIKDEIVLRITSSGIGIPQWWYSVGMPVWSLLVILRVVEGTIRLNRRLR